MKKFKNIIIFAGTILICFFGAAYAKYRFGGSKQAPVNDTQQKIASTDTNQSTAQITPTEAPTQTPTVTPSTQKMITSPKTAAKQAATSNAVTTEEITPTPTPTDTPTPTPTEAPAPQISIYDFAGVDQSKVIDNSTEYKVTISNLSPKIGENVKFTVEPTTGTNRVYIVRAEIYGNNMMHGGSNGQWLEDSNGNKTNVYSDTIVIQNWPLQANNIIESYVFIKSLDSDKVYQYKNTLHVQ